jgi:hypothetical protein
VPRAGPSCVPEGATAKRAKGEKEGACGKRRGVKGFFTIEEKTMTHASGEKCATQLFTEMHVGNASPARWVREQNEKEKRDKDKSIRSSVWFLV